MSLLDVEPLADSYRRYLKAGWKGVLSLPPHAKASPPNGYTGETGADPTPELIAEWARANPAGNIGLRLPAGVLGIDVDAYKEAGKQSLERLIAELGPLPATWTSTSRSDGISGIRLYRIPLGVKVRGIIAEGIDAIQHHHRYLVVAPSTHPDSGDSYRWISPDGELGAGLPTPDLLPELPERWLEALREHERLPGAPPQRSYVDEWSPSVTKAHSDAVAGLRREGGRHDNACAGAASLAMYEVLEHPGATDALESLGSAFRNAIADRAKPAAAQKEWDDILVSARSKAAATTPTAPKWVERRTNGHMPVELEQLVAGGGAAVESGTPVIPILPADFWAERPVLAHIRQAAHSRIRAPDLVLHAVLARVAAYSLHTIEIPPIVGSPGSLNYFTSAIGPSGSGKSSGVSIAAELVPRPGIDVADNQPLGSGEGLAELYMGTVEEDDEKGKKVKVRKQVRHNAFVYGDEGAALTAMMQRQGATLPEALRRAWTGADLGQANANADRTRVIHAGQYRMGLVVGFQPELAGRLLDDADAGTPQRFTWAYAVDPGVPDELPSWPGELEIPAIGPLDLADRRITVRGYVRHRMGVDEKIVHELQSQAKERVRGTTSLAALDAHEPLHRLKLAALLAILDGRLDINLEDWSLADVIWTTSCAVRASVVEAVRASSERTEAARTDVQARRELVVQAARLSAPQKVERLARRLGKWVHEAPDRPEDGWAMRDLRHRLKSDERPLLDAAISAAIDSAWLVESYGRYLPGGSIPA